MRTTLTLDDDLYRLIEQRARKTNEPLKKVVNDAIRAGLGTAGKPAAREPYKAEVFHSKLRPGIDPLHLNRLAAELETEDFLRKLEQGK